MIPPIEPHLQEIGLNATHREIEDLPLYKLYITCF